MPKVQLPNGQQLDFPDGMSDSEMADAIDANFPEYAAKKEGGLMGMLNSFSDTIKNVPVIAPNGDGGSVMETTRPAAPDLPPANLSGLAPSKWAEVRAQEHTDPLDARLLAIKPGDIVARAQNEAARQHHAGDEQFSRVADDAHLQVIRDAAEADRQSKLYTAENLAGNTVDNVRNVGAGLMKIGPTAAKGIFDIGRMISGDMVGKDASNYFERGMNTIDQLIASPQFNENAAGFHQMMSDQHAGVGDMFSYLVDHPQILLDNGITTVGSMALPAGTAKLAAIGSRAAGLGTAAAGAVGTATTVGTVAAQNAADTFTSDSLQGAAMGDRYKAASVSAAISILTGMFTHGGAEGQIARRMAGDLQAGRTTLDAVKGFLKAVGNEGAQEAGEEFGNAAGEAVGSLTPMDPKNTGKRMAFAAAVGGLFGGMTHVSGAGEQAHDQAAAGVDAGDVTAAPAASSSEPTLGAPGAPVPETRREPTIADITGAATLDEAIAAAQAVTSQPLTSPYATAADIDALEAAAAPAPAELAKLRNLASSGDLEGIDLTSGPTDHLKDMPAPDASMRPAAGAPTPQRDAIDRIINDSADWHAFPADTGTLGIPRADMPQIKAEHRGAMTQFLNARGITHEQVEVPAESLKPTQAEFSLDKVLKAHEYQGGNRSILVSSDNYVLDGHHQWLSAVDKGESVKAIRLGAPIADLLETVKEFPSATVAEGAPAPTGGKPQWQVNAELKETRLQQQLAVANENAAKRTAGRRARDRVQSENPFLAFLAGAGVNIDERADAGAERGRAGNPLVPGYGPIFRKSGLRFDELALAAQQAGFLTQADIDSASDTGGTRKLADMIARATQAKEVIHQAGMLEQGAPHADEQLVAEAQRLGIETNGATPDQLYDAVVAAHGAREQRRGITGAATVDEQAEIEQYADQITPETADLVADLDEDIPLFGLKTDANLTDEQLDEIFGIQSAARPARASGERTEGNPGTSAREGDRRTEGAQGDILTSYGREEVVARQNADTERARALEAERAKLDGAARKARDQKDIVGRMDASAENFQLGQSADDALSGQADIFSERINPGETASKAGKIASEPPKTASNAGKSETPARETAADLMKLKAGGKVKIGTTTIWLSEEDYGWALNRKEKGGEVERSVYGGMGPSTKARVLKLARDFLTQQGTTPDQLPSLDGMFDELLAEETAAKPVGDLGELFDGLLAEELNGAKAAESEPVAAATGIAGEKAKLEGKRKPRASRSAGQAATSAAKNTAVGMAAAVQGLGELFGATIDPKAGVVPEFDESKYRKAVPLFQAAIDSFGAAAADIREVMRVVIKAVIEQFGAQVTANMKPYVVRFVQDYQDGKLEGEKNADGTGGNTERDPGNGTDGEPGAEPSLFDVPKPNRHRARQTGSAPDVDGARPVDRAGVSGRDAADGRAARDQHVPDGQRPGRPAAGAAESGNAGRGGDRGNEESQSQSDAVGEPATALGARLSLDQKRADQRAADSISVIVGDRANIDATLPFLLEGQRDDVHFAEQRFASQDKQPGVMFTNGTGTGKTYTGLGIAKRFDRQGKTEGIIVVPNSQIAQDWITSGRDLGMNIRSLESTSANGDKGITITTYANFGDNPTLADRKFDWVMADEAHYLMASKDGKQTKALSTLRAITQHPDGFYQYSRMKNRALYAKLDAANAAKADKATLQKLFKQIHDADEALLPAYQATAGSPLSRPKTVFLSATPFAYVKSVDYAQGYLFEYQQKDSSAYNSGDGREAFFMQHFGYRMRYNKLTAPDGSVNEGLMARQFNTYLKQQGALSGRMLDVEADYDRKFVMVHSALGTKIDEGLEFIREHDEYKHLYDPLMKSFDYLSRRFLLEAIKAKEALPMIRQHLDIGRKVVIVHDYKKGGAFNPFTLQGINGTKHVWDGDEPVEIDLADLAAKFRAERADLARLEFPTQSALQILGAAFPDALVHNGDVPPKQLELNKKQFNADTGEHRVMFLQSDKGREGISLHDTTGRYQRVEVNIGLPSKPTALIQLEGRVYRTGQITDAVLRYLNTGTMWERWTFAQTIAERADTAEALAMGDLARGLKDSIIEAFEESEDHPVTSEDGKGGKARDRQNAKLLSEWDRAKSFYFGQQKKTGRNKAAEGKDYFATPEPLGLKMVEWADIRPGEDVIEPSGGHGAIARWFPIQSNKTIVEPSTELITRARLVVDGDAKFVQSNFEYLHIVNKYDAIVMNPPFGIGGSLSTPHLAKAYEHLRDGGRIVAIIPRGPAADAKFEKFLYGDKAPKDLYMVADINLPAATFGRAGTAAMTRVVILDKVGDPAKVPNQMIGRDYTDAQDVGALFDRLEHSTVPGRVKTDAPVEIAIEEAKPAPKAKKSARAAVPDATGAERFYAQFEFVHTKTGDDLFGASMLNRVSMDTYKEALSIAKQNGGWYNKFAGGGAQRGFLFKSADERTAFMEAAGQLDEVGDGLDAQNARMQESTPEFKKWFGDSKVVNELGEPLVVYHGTGESFDSFKIPAFFTEDKSGAEWYMTERGDDDQHIEAVYLSIKNPFEAGSADGHKALVKLARDAGVEIETIDGWFDYAPEIAEHSDYEGTNIHDLVYIPKVREALLAAGYDGVHGDDQLENSEIPMWIAFTPQQIKSAIGNGGTFDGSNPDIMASAMPVFYSALARAVPAMAKIAAKDGTIKAEQARLWLTARQKEGKFKADELLWSGVDDWLKARGGKVMVDDISLFLEQNGVQIEEVHKGSSNPNTKTFASMSESELRAAGEERFGPGFMDGLDYSNPADRANMVEDLANSMLEDDNGIYEAGTKYSQYVLPGGENYREILLTLPALPGISSERALLEEQQRSIQSQKNKLGEQYTAILDALPISERAARRAELSVSPDYLELNGQGEKVAEKLRAMQAPLYIGSHWDENNIVAHIRFNDRTDADGKRVLFIEELQSDWGQDGLKKGFREEATDPWETLKQKESLSTEFRENDPDFDGPVWVVLDEHGDYIGTGLTEREAIQSVIDMDGGRTVPHGQHQAGVAPAPFVTDTKAWLSLGVKRMIRYAAENGYDKVAFVNGQQSTDRYDLSQQVEQINYRNQGGGLFDIAAIGKKNRQAVLDEKGITLNRVEELVGKDIAQKIERGEGKVMRDGGDEWWISLSGVDLKVGGEGMKSFYDKIVPQTISDVLKRLGGGKVATIDIEVPGLSSADRNYYVGQEHSLEALKDALVIARQRGGNIMENPLTGKKVAFAFNRVANETSLRRLISLMESGAPFSTAVLDDDLVSNGFGELMGGEFKPLPKKKLSTTQQVGFDITPELRTSALDGLPMFSKSFDPARRQLLAAAAAAAMSTGAKAGDVKVGQAAPINAAVLAQRVAPAVETILRDGQEGGTTSLNGTATLRKAMKAMALTGPKEIRALASLVEKLLPTSGTVMLTVDDRTRMNVHGVVELSPFVHLSLFTAEGRTGLTYETLLHEALHVAVAARYRSLSVGMVRGNDAIMGLSAPQAAAALKKFEQVWEEFRTATAAEKFGNQTLELAVTEARGNPDEFFVRSLTDPVLQAYLAGKRYEGKTLLGRFKDWVKSSLFGFSKSGTAPSWLDAALAASGDVAAAMGADKADFLRMAAISSAQVQRNHSRANIQEGTPEFKTWFGDSKVVNERGEPLVVYHGTDYDFSQFDGLEIAGWFAEDPTYASHNYTSRGYAEDMGEVSQPNVMAVYLSIKNPLVLDFDISGENLTGREIYERAGLSIEGIDKYTLELSGQPAYLTVSSKPFERAAKRAGYDGIKVSENGHATWAIFDSAQAKSSIGNNGRFDGSNPDIMAQRALPAPSWTDPDMNGLDNIIHTLQDRHIDTRRVVQSVRSEMGALEDKWDPYLQEELFHGRAATGFKDYLHNELRPLLSDMQARGVTVEEFEEYLHMRHAQEANEQIASVNPEMPDSGSGIKTADAQDFLANQDPARLRAFEALAARIDAMTAETSRLLVDYGLEKQETIAAWNATYDHYVPLMREDMEAGKRGNGTGQGFSVRGPASRRRMGSERNVINIVANIAMARERAVVRGEKNRLDMALYGLALKAPNPEFWRPINPRKNPDALAAELDAMGLSPALAANIIAEPRQRVIDKQTGLVVRRANPLLRSAPNVVAVRVNGEDRFIFFNEKNERAMRMAITLKNMGNDGLNRFLSTAGIITRAFAAINTQYNPIFGVVNLLRDTGEGAVNLAATPLAGRQHEVLAEVGRLLGHSAVKGFRLDNMTGADLALWNEFQHEGGITGYRAMFGNSDDRAKELAKELKKMSAGAMSKAGRAVFDWLSDYNEALENVTRMGVYKVAKEHGMTNQQSASLAKNLTVNFNRKGAVGSQVGALYAFFNASVQGTARMAATLASPAGKKIIAGGLLLGVMQAVMMAAAGFDDEEPPEFIKAKNVVIPLGWISGKKNYITVPMPLGFAFIPTIGRIGAEFGLHGGKKPGKYIGKLLDALADTFNPIGNAGFSVQTIAPTAVDPFVALSENKDWTGKPIARKDLNALKPTPGYTRTKDTASAVSKFLSYYLNTWSGGTKYTPGAFSPTPDQIDYLLGQFTGGVGREALKAQQTVSAAVTGEELPAYKIPLAGRFYGNAEDKSSVSAKFYDNLLELNLHNEEVTGRAKDHGDARGYLAEHPEARLADLATSVQRDMQELGKHKRELIQKGADRARIKEIELKMRSTMQRFNDKVEEAKKKAPA